MQKILSILLLCLGAAAAQAQTIVIPFQDVHGRMMIDSKINGHPARLLIDTGSQRSLDLHLLRPIRPIIRGNSLEFEHTWDEPLNVLMAPPEEKFDGIIGIDTVRYYKSLRIDYRRHVIELGD